MSSQSIQCYKKQNLLCLPHADQNETLITIFIFFFSIYSFFLPDFSYFAGWWRAPIIFFWNSPLNILTYYLLAERWDPNPAENNLHNRLLFMKAKNACKLSRLFKSGLVFPAEFLYRGTKSMAHWAKHLKKKIIVISRSGLGGHLNPETKENAFAQCLISWVGANPDHFQINACKESGCASAPPRNESDLSFRSCPPGCHSGRKEKKKKRGEKKAKQFVLLAEKRCGGGTLGLSSNINTPPHHRPQDQRPSLAIGFSLISWSRADLSVCALDDAIKEKAR